MTQHSHIMAISNGGLMVIKIKDWLAKNSEPFSLLCGEDFTNREVLLMHVYAIAVIGACCLAEWINSL